MAKKKKTSTETKALRREIEALKAQLKDQNIQPFQTKKTSEKTEVGISYSEIASIKSKDRTKPIQQESTISINEDASYLVKDMKKTALFSFLIITSIIIVRILDIF